MPRCITDRLFGGVATDDGTGEPVSECRCANKKKSWEEKRLACTKANNKNGRANRGDNRGE